VNPGTVCATVPANGTLVVDETVVFDEHENGEGVAAEEADFSPVIGTEAITTPETSLQPITPGADMFPQSIVSNANAGWVYMNLQNPADPDSANGVATQNWVIVSMRAEGRYSVDFDAAWLGNGCSPVAEITGFSGNGPAINNPGAQNPAAILPGPADDFNP
jgi:hypothetical protein